MSAAHDGGQAFPGQWDHGQGQIESWVGMSLRDYFAARAMAAMTVGSWPGMQDRSEISKRAYLMADAMLEARK